MKACHRRWILACVCLLTALLTACGTSKQFVYVAEPGSTTISGFISDTSAGTLTAMEGSPFSAGAVTRYCFRTCFVVDPKNQFLYVAQEHQLAMFAIDPSNGALTPVQGSPFTANVLWLETDPKGRFVYATANNGILGWSVDRNNRTLVPIAGAPFGASGTQAVSVDPQGKFLYVPDVRDEDYSCGVQAYAINGANGSLSPSGARQVATCDAVRMIFHPSGEFAYLEGYNQLDDLVLRLIDIDPDTRAMSGLQGPIYNVSSYPFPGRMHVSPNGNWVFTDGYASQFSINASTGELTNLGTLPSFGGGVAFATDIAVGNEFVYPVVAGSNELRVYSIDARSGKTSLVTSSPVTTTGHGDLVVAATH